METRDKGHTKVPAHNHSLNEFVPVERRAVAWGSVPQGVLWMPDGSFALSSRCWVRIGGTTCADYNVQQTRVPRARMNVLCRGGIGLLPCTIPDMGSPARGSSGFLPSFPHREG